MKKITYEYLNSKTIEIHKRLDNISAVVCYLKTSIDDISDILKAEYEQKYLKTKTTVKKSGGDT